MKLLLAEPDETYWETEKSGRTMLPLITGSQMALE
jgi:hypothetical protein